MYRGTRSLWSGEGKGDWGGARELKEWSASSRCNEQRCCKIAPLQLLLLAGAGGQI